MPNRDHTRSIHAPQTSNADSTDQKGVVGVVESEDQFVSYANACEFQVSGEDACIRFGLKKAHQKDVAKGVATIYLSLSQFKRLVVVGSAVIKTIEDELGIVVEHDPNQRLAHNDAVQKIQTAATQALPSAQLEIS